MQMTAYHLYLLFIYIMRIVKFQMSANSIRTKNLSDKDVEQFLNNLSNSEDGSEFDDDDSIDDPDLQPDKSSNRIYLHSYSDSDEIDDRPNRK